MRITLKGIHTAKVKLASGEPVTYYYAWRNGPRLAGEPGSAEFLASFNAAHASRREPDAATLLGVIAGYKVSQDFLGLAPRTQSDYRKQLAKIEQQFGTMPLTCLEDPRVTMDFLQWRDDMSSPKQADYHFSTLMRLLSWARGRGLTTYRPPERVEHRYHSDRSEKIWGGNRHCRVHGGCVRADAARAGDGPGNRTAARRFVDAALVGLRRTVDPLAPG